MPASARPRVLFLAHSASRNGASILLLHLMRWLRSQVDWECDVLFQSGGVLLDEFRKVADSVRVWRDPSPVFDLALRRQLPAIRRALDRCYAQWTRPTAPYDLVYANTSAAAPLVRLMSRTATPLLWHIHEMSYALRLTLSDEDIDWMLPAATRFVAVSEAVKGTLSSSFGVPSERIAVVQGFVPVDAGSAHQRGDRRRSLAAALQWPADAFVVGGCGSLGWRKGTDLFLQCARSVVSRPGRENVRFLWVGGSASDREAFEFEHDLRALGLAGRCRLVHSASDVSDYYAAMDVFALTSREDPFPLVMLEAGAHELPVVCFADSGGAAEYVRSGGGLSVPYLDVDAFSEQIVRLQDRPDLRLALAGAGKRCVTDHYQVQVQGPKLLSAMRSCLSKPSSVPTLEGELHVR